MVSAAISEAGINELLRISSISICSPASRARIMIFRITSVPPRSSLGSGSVYGKDNVVLFYTDRYSEQPLVVKGAGAGADVTASGVFADIMRAAKI